MIIEIETYKCPKCQKAMERGYVSSTNTIRWTITSTISISGLEGENLTPWSIKMPGAVKCSALRCRKCHLVIFKDWKEITKEKIKAAQHKAIQHLNEPVYIEDYCEKYQVTPEQINFKINEGELQAYEYNGVLFIDDKKT